MIDLKTAEKQLRRLRGLDYFPSEEEAQVELIAALRTAATEAVVIRVVNEWIAEQRECPKPADLYRLIRDANDHVLPPRECSRCRNWGIYGGHMGGMYGPWRWCTCPAGRDLKARAPQTVDDMNAANQQKAEVHS